MKKRKLGRLEVPFEKLETIAATERSPLTDGMALSRKSAIYRCKNGSLTIQLHFKGADNLSVTQTFRNVWPNHE